MSGTELAMRAILTGAALLAVALLVHAEKAGRSAAAVACGLFAAVLIFSAVGSWGSVA